MANDNHIIPSQLIPKRQEPSEGDIYLPTTTTQSTNLMAVDLYLSSLLFRQKKCQRPSSQALDPILTHPPRECSPTASLHLSCTFSSSFWTQTFPSAQKGPLES